VSSGEASPHLRASLRNAWLNGWTQLLGLALSLSTSLLLARLAGVDALGLYTFSGGLAGMLVAPTSFAINTIVARETARTRSAAAGLLAGALGLSLAVSLPLASLATGVVGRWAGLETYAWFVLLLSALLQSVRNVRGVLYGLLQGLSRFDVILALEALGLTATLAAGASALSSGAGVLGFVVTCLLVECGLFTVSLAYVVLRLVRPQPAQATSHWAFLIASGLPVAFTGLANTINLRVDSVMLGLFRSHAEVGYYSAAFSAYLAVGVFLNALTMGFFPSLSRLSRTDAGEFGRLVGTSVRLIALTAALFAAALVLAGKPALGLLYGEGFERAFPPLSILIAGVPLIGLQRLLGTALTACGRQRLGLYAAAIGAAAHVGAAWILVPARGMAGAALSTITGEALGFAAALLFLLPVLRPGRSRPALESVAELP
jgi:O-antigen/teichoic acid export membrane protein